MVETTLALTKLMPVDPPRKFELRLSHHEKYLNIIKKIFEGVQQEIGKLPTKTQPLKYTDEITIGPKIILRGARGALGSLLKEVFIGIKHTSNQLTRKPQNRIEFLNQIETGLNLSLTIADIFEFAVAINFPILIIPFITINLIIDSTISVIFEGAKLGADNTLRKDQAHTFENEDDFELGERLFTLILDERKKHADYSVIAAPYNYPAKIMKRIIIEEGKSLEEALEYMNKKMLDYEIEKIPDTAKEVTDALTRYIYYILNIPISNLQGEKYKKKELTKKRVIIQSKIELLKKIGIDFSNPQAQPSPTLT